MEMTTQISENNFLFVKIDPKPTLWHLKSQLAARAERKRSLEAKRNFAKQTARKRAESRKWSHGSSDEWNFGWVIGEAGRRRGEAGRKEEKCGADETRWVIYRFWGNYRARRHSFLPSAGLSEVAYQSGSDQSMWWCCELSHPPTIYHTNDVFQRRKKVAKSIFSFRYTFVPFPQTKKVYD